MKCEVFTPLTTTTTELVTTTTAIPLPDDFCKGVIFERFPHPNNCFQFVVCLSGNANIVDCDPNEVFYNMECVPG